MLLLQIAIRILLFVLLFKVLPALLLAGLPITPELMILRQFSYVLALFLLALRARHNRSAFFILLLLAYNGRAALLELLHPLHCLALEVC